MTSRRIVAETCLRALVTESPPVRKVLAMNIMEQYVHAAGDLVGLVLRAQASAARQPVMRAFLGFKLDRASALAFFQELATTPQSELLASPRPADAGRRSPNASRRCRRATRAT